MSGGAASASATAAAGGKLAGGQVYEFKTGRRADAFERGLRASGHPSGLIRDAERFTIGMSPAALLTDVDPGAEALDCSACPRTIRAGAQRALPGGRVYEQLSGELSGSGGSRRISRPCSRRRRARGLHAGVREGHADVFVRLDGTARPSSAA